MWQTLLNWLTRIRRELDQCPYCGKPNTGGRFCSTECWQAQLH